MHKWLALTRKASHQIYISLSHDPYLNLSIEHHLLQKTPPQSNILFLYVNRPCVVIGRNQNPWLELNLGLLHQKRQLLRDEAGGNGSARDGVVEELWDVEVVRRRSGGGAVFHDHGNLNWSVITPPSAFTRDKHAEMVTSAIRKFNPRARVNERHDIVLDQGPILEERFWPEEGDMHRSRFEVGEEGALKCSGSAYKLTRQRALHHGTCLLASPYLGEIGRFLRSPARGFLRARGVESVRSSVGNVCGGVGGALGSLAQNFRREVVKAFRGMYGIGEVAPPFFDIEGIWGKEEEWMMERDGWAYGIVDQRLGEVNEIRDGVAELKSPKWRYGQTPQFTLSSHPDVKDSEEERPPLPQDFPPSARVHLTVRGGEFTESKISLSFDEDVAMMEREKFDRVLKGQCVHEIANFEELLSKFDDAASPMLLAKVSNYLNTMFGKEP